MKERRNRGIGSVLLWGCMRLLALLPYCIRYYVLQEIIAFVFRDLLRYRRRLIIRQLTDSFPEKTEKEIRTLCRKYYSTLAEMVVNTISMAGISDAEREARATVHGKGCVCGCDMGKDIVVLTSHLGFWEYYTAPAMRMRRTHDLYVAYHPVQNRAVDDFFIRIRSMKQCTPIPSSQVLRSFIEFDRTQGRNLILGLVSDQNAKPYSDTPHWFRFLNHDTIFFNGGERIALKYRLPVFYEELERVRRGYYRCSYRMIYDGVESVEENEITERYVRCLEESIRRNPEMWMWSHNRWKFTRDPETGKAKRIPYSRSRQRRIDRRERRKEKR